MQNKMVKISIIGLFIILIDQIIKILVKQNLAFMSSISIIEDFFNISYVKNYGAAWSIFSGNRMFLIFIAIISLNLIYFCLIKDSKPNKIDIIIYGVLIGGIFGNLFDRIFYGYVIDYLDFKIFNYNFPVFNFADMCIVISMIIISYKTLIGGNEKNENNS